jgi:hypothetical protein
MAQAKHPSSCSCHLPAVYGGSRLWEVGTAATRRKRAASMAASAKRRIRAHPPRASTTLRQETESFALFSRRHAFICGGLPICSAQNAVASERQAICSSRVGPDCAVADEPAAISRTSETYTDFFMDHFRRVDLWGLKVKHPEHRRGEDHGPCHVHGVGGPFTVASSGMIPSNLRAAADTPIYMGCYGAWPCPMYLSRRLRRPIGPPQGRTF